MAIARRVTDWERPTVAWVEIEDTDGATHRYNKGSAAPAGATVHVSYGLTPGGAQGLGLVRGGDGQPLLRQDKPGLPAKIVVHYLGATPARGAPNPVGWEEQYEYDHQ